ncbi:sodium:solute symporter family protein [Pontibaca salina]|uniref:Sodium:solute symporter family protein n=1 Tax=Pontibaca salina TaxID=2795731 RepID=A0A934HRI3_9RHOB|nr:sodium:solute symporter family protein [Pontibaca salina]MBI6628299.1 sodium:solute symporter family protein [Pontibaca salina]
MTAAGAWTIGLAVIYTVALVVVGRIVLSRRHADGSASGFFVAGRNFSPLTVAFCITGLFSGSSFIAIIELSYRTGISAVWYGVAETVQVLLIAIVLVKPLREKLVVTVSGVIGERFGRVALGVGGAITAFTFPMWSVATAIAFASALHTFTELSIYASIIATAVLLLVFLWTGGMRAVAFTQTMNCILFAAMVAVGMGAVLIKPGISGLSDLITDRPAMFDLFAAGPTLIVAWFGTFIVNVILAQAAFQMALSCRTAKDGQKGLYLAALFGTPLILASIVLGTATAIVVPDQGRALVAVPIYIAEVLPAPLVGVFFLGVWACALSWAGPCQFSGATSLGRDVGRAIRPNASEADLIRYTRWALVLLTLLMIFYAFLRAEDSAWWNVLAWTLRNGATLAPMLAVFFWPLANRGAVILAMLAGFATGLGWYHAGDWSPQTFFLDLHPVWVGMSANLATLVVVTLLTARWQFTTNMQRQRTAMAFGGAVGALIATVVLAGPMLERLGFGGLVLFVGVVLASGAAFLLTAPAALAQNQKYTIQSRKLPS